MKALLMDTTLCIACRGCQVACKQWNRLDAEQTSFFHGGGYQNPAHRSTRTWNLITFNEVENGHGMDWVFGRRQCNHCIEPACVTACPVGALTKTAEGPVHYDESRCIGCRYCQVVCPFNAPRFEWNDPNPEIRKCTMCADRIAMGSEPACSQSCTTKALIFGDREELLSLAKERIAKSPNRYVSHVYGEKEAGGACVLYLAKAPFEKMGFATGLPDKPFSSEVKTAMAAIPFAITGSALALGALYWVINRRLESYKESSEDES
ncbi:Periplasmic formate dehydrogenase FdhABC, beta subunit (iron-sulfur subunit) [Desulfatibacillum aliphaticivorans]|uniref:Periplasmic formate dehydrogenase FdhABC, beta subunit (Iron-sulfur subunit) n=1 Tax=Desulfatibacillum aliphaticivorans TaxID=218208 RepID=B8FFZ7_DESAL|nr:4Fe-4S dicluster domain-containing protein [Desulfatibacillum aliphaticivorans]ACL03552.1 Periplasmic formate dehydrogenase FdhABC, beta subunit (iron-sulfur subunit) [Desulfatibacillum aliphaticivorans]